MTSKGSIILGGFLCFSLATGAFADTLVAKAKKTKHTHTHTKAKRANASNAAAAPAAPVKKAVVATPAPLPSDKPVDAPIPPDHRDFRARVVGAFGFGTTSSNIAKNQAARSAVNFDRNFFSNGRVDLQWRYLGMELEGYYGTGGSGTFSTVDHIGGKVDTRARSLRTFGGNLDFQGRYTLRHWGRDWNWHAGLGYGFNGVKQFAPVTLGSTVTSSTLRVSGLYTTAGLEVCAIPYIAITIDYAFSLGASATNTVIDTASASTATDYDGARFDRFRLGAAYIINPHFRVGAEYSRRQTKGTLAGNDTVETGNHWLGTVVATW